MPRNRFGLPRKPATKAVAIELAGGKVKAQVLVVKEGAHFEGAVLMSPACASLDMFDNYVHRAQVFADAVRSLAGQEGVPAREVA